MFQVGLIFFFVFAALLIPVSHLAMMSLDVVRKAVEAWCLKSTKPGAFVMGKHAASSARLMARDKGRAHYSGQVRCRRAIE
jgi:hypothetical protein